MLLRFYSFVEIGELLNDVCIMLMTGLLGDVCYLSVATLCEIFNMHHKVHLNDS